jgi:Fic family protein
MAKVIRRHWPGSMGVGGSRRDRRPCVYEAYVPDPLAGRAIRLDGDVVADVTEAEAAIVRLNREAATLVDTEALARLLLRAEAVASSRIEGLEVGGRRLLRAEAARALGDDPRDVTAAEVLGNIEAMVWATQTAADWAEISVGHLSEMHRRLLAATRLAAHAGQLRTQQNWIGGSSYNPCSAAFVPPPPELVRPLLEDLCAFCNDDALSPLVQAALAHAQFETIHPFIDGNGRTGRALIHLILRRRGLAPRVIPPISLILATWSRDYVGGLTATRYRGAAISQTAHEGLNRWVGLFAAATRRAVADAEEFEERIRQIQVGWRKRLGRVRANSAADLLIRGLPGAPIVTANSAVGLTGRSFQAVNQAVARLADAKVVSQVSVGRRNRAFEAPEVIRAFANLERQLASPAGDTRVSPPSRVTPRRRQEPSAGRSSQRVGAGMGR